MPGEKILVIEDEHDIRELISYNLESEGYDIIKASSGNEGIEKVQKNVPDLILLDIMLPDIDGLEVCRKLKREDATKDIPIIMLTAKSEDSDIISGLELGAEDYITKPFSPRVLIARLRAVLRRNTDANEAESTVLTVHEIQIDAKKHEVLVEGENINLSATEFAILSHLATNPGWVFSRNQIIDAVRGQNYPVTERSVDVQILGIRKKLGSQGRYIETVRGVGYRIK
ncbi:MAG: response regulator [Spirochaetales bacterium]|uniref:Response regulator n=1 Tax=Candidatus Thalassospirochaeta sargassi TaxID=3119039 RepID=A0AAJ1MIQ1_9SPIO|nr:response regulator [Spirochaetales bacterium]